jgi:hypothetical protein
MRLLDACCLWATEVVLLSKLGRNEVRLLTFMDFSFLIDAMKCHAVIGKKTLYLIYFSSLRSV